MMFYVDTDIILSYSYSTESQHWRATYLIDNIKGDFYASPLTIVELYCTISRNIEKYKLPYKKFRSLSDEIKVKMVTEHAIRKLDMKICSDDAFNKEIAWIKAKVYSRYFDAIDLAPKVKLRTGDILHVTYAYQLKKAGKIQHILSFDDEFRKKKDLIKTETGIEVFQDNLT